MSITRGELNELTDSNGERLNLKYLSIWMLTLQSLIKPNPKSAVTEDKVDSDLVMTYVINVLNKTKKIDIVHSKSLIQAQFLIIKNLIEEKCKFIKSALLILEDVFF